MMVHIPSELEALRDSAVAFAHGRLKTCPDLKPIEDWFENGEGWDDVVMSVEGGAVCLDSIADQYFSNTLMRDYVDLLPKARISKAQKLEFARSRLEYALQQTDDSIHAVCICDHPETYLGCFIFGQGQAGWIVEWVGLFKSREEFIRIDEGCNGYFVDQSHISDEKILSLWTR